MYVGRQHTVTATAKTVLPFRCVHCGHSARALVVGVGQGAGNSPYFLDEQGAKGRARSKAEEAAHENAELTVRLAECPKCGKTDGSALSSLKGKAAAGAIACIVLFPVFGLILDGMQKTSFGLWIFAPLGVLTAWLVWAKQKWKWETAATRVAFVPEDDKPKT
jgi:hypothetical protein